MLYWCFADAFADALPLLLCCFAALLIQISHTVALKGSPQSLALLMLYWCFTDALLMLYWCFVRTRCHYCSAAVLLYWYKYHFNVALKGSRQGQLFKSVRSPYIYI
jgi:hypothetical protein